MESVSGKFNGYPTGIPEQIEKKLGRVSNSQSGLLKKL